MQRIAITDNPKTQQEFLERNNLVEPSSSRGPSSELAVISSSKGLPEGCERLTYERSSGRPYYKYKAPGVAKQFLSLVQLLKHTSLKPSAQAADSNVIVSPQAPGSSKGHAAIVPPSASVLVKPPHMPIVVVPRRLTAVSQRASTPAIKKSRSKSRNSAGKARLDKLLQSSHGWDVAR